MPELDAILGGPKAVIVLSDSAFDHDDNAALVRELIGRTGFMADRIEFRTGYLYGDWAEPGWTWLTIVLDEAGEQALDAVVTALVAWGVAWIKRARKRNPNTAPVKVIVYGPDGQELRTVEVLPPEGS